MKRLYFLAAGLLFFLSMFAQSPQKLSYQAIIRNSAGKLVQNTTVGLRISILQGSVSGTEVYSETHTPLTNINGLITVEIGSGITPGNLSSIDWANGPYFLKSETDPSGGSNYSITGTTQLLSVPYALYSEKAANGFSGDYNDLINKPVIDGSETKVSSGYGIAISGNGTIAAPYVFSAAVNKIVITSSGSWSVPDNISKIKVELWGASGGGGGANLNQYSYYYVNGGDGGSGGFMATELNVTPNQQFQITIGAAGTAGVNSYYGYGDTDGGNGGDSWFDYLKAAGGKGGKRGSYSSVTVNGLQGTDNVGPLTAYADPSNSAILNVFQGLERSYIADRILTSNPGKGGSVINSYSSTFTTPKPGEAGCAIITLW